MHSEALAWVAQFATEEALDILDIGGRDVTGPWGGSPRHLFPNATYRVLDIAEGPDVDIVADAATWVPDREYAMVLAVELFEHAASWPRICRTVLDALAPGGRFVTTMAGPGRPPHGARGAPGLEIGEHYANIRPDRLRQVLEQVGFTDVVIDQRFAPCDVRADATKR